MDFIWDLVILFDNHKIFLISKITNIQLELAGENVKNEGKQMIYGIQW